MTTVALRELHGSYPNVVSDDAVHDVRRLVLLTLDLENSTSVSTVLPVPEPPPSILDLEGLGREVWEGIDPRQYVSELRNEWNHHRSPAE